MQTAGCDRGSHRQAGARLSHNHRICKDFNNDPLGLMIDNRSGVNAHAYVNAVLRRPIYWGSLRATLQTLLDCTRIINTRVDLTEKQTAIMVKNFSADWLAQSFHAAAPDDVPEPEKKRHRPHVPCLAQPRPPTSYDKIYVQPKPKVAKVEQKPESNSVPKEKEALVPVAPRHCSSPSISENSGYSSGYESEAAASECASVEDGHELEKEAVQRRIRTKFTPEQIDKLEKIFNKHKYLDAGERIKTALKLNLSETQVRTWFQNRRMKLKREVQEMQADYFLPALVLPHVHPGVQYHCYDRQRFQFPAQVLASVMHHHQISAQHRIPHHHMMMPQHYY
ncbi:homeobox protein vent1-like [Triplophysa dalaica]|uniref:homeobox protein vent1-like n=1 Tax=Triplophysa dalaica TaxID=1582913 RepID=UPI0024E0230E|nr:homeobox protein vent1-like [Triplophysa dalaica]